MTAAAPKRITFDDLKPEHQKFVEAFVENSRVMDHTDASINAVMQVYGYDRNNARAYAWTLLRNPKIKAVLVDRTAAIFSGLHIVAAEKLAEIITTGTINGQAVKPTDMLKAIDKALDRGFGPVITKHEVEVNDNRNVQDLRAALADKLAQLSPEDRKTLAQRMGGGVIDVTAEEVDPVKTFDPAAPWGRKKDGTPRVYDTTPKKRVLPGPDAFRREKRPLDEEGIRKMLKERAVANARSRALYAKRKAEADAEAAE